MQVFFRCCPFSTRVQDPVLTFIASEEFLKFYPRRQRVS